jgi:hypothetical protein
VVLARGDGILSAIALLRNYTEGLDFDAIAADVERRGCAGS